MIKNTHEITRKQAAALRVVLENLAEGGGFYAASVPLLNLIPGFALIRAPHGEYGLVVPRSRKVEGGRRGPDLARRLVQAMVVEEGLAFLARVKIVDDEEEVHADT